MRPPIRTLIASLLAAGACTAMAGTVSVSFINPTSYSDAGTTAWDGQANLKTLAAHLEQLGQRWLPAGQVLKVEIVDVDLAGYLRPQRDGTQLRVVRGGADWPSIKLRYTLEENGKALRSDEDQVSDMTYAQGMAGRRDSTPLYHDKRMLEGWFKARFAPPA